MTQETPGCDPVPSVLGHSFPSSGGDCLGGDRSSDMMASLLKFFGWWSDRCNILKPLSTICYVERNSLVRDDNMPSTSRISTIKVGQPGSSMYLMPRRSLMYYDNIHLRCQK